GTVVEGSQIAGAVAAQWAGPWPVAHRLRGEPRLSIVVGQELGLRLAALRKTRLQHLGNALMVLLARAPEQGLIGDVLDQGVSKAVRRLWRQSLLIQELCFH